MTAPVLIVGIGNPSRGDDALGPLMIERLEGLGFPGIELLTDFQLQVEYAVDVHGRELVVFVDAAVSGPEPFRFEAVEPVRDVSYSSHELSPSAVLHAHERLYGPAPTAYTLAIRGYEFGLGESTSRHALENLEAAYERLLACIRDAGQGAPMVD